MSLSHVQPELAEAYLTRSKADSERVTRLLKDGDLRARLFLTSVLVSTLTRIVFVLTAALVTENLVLGGLVVFLGVMHKSAFSQVEANLFPHRWRKNMGGLLVNAMVFGGILYAAQSALSEVALEAGLVVAAFLVSWALWLLNYKHLTGRSLRTGK